MAMVMIAARSKIAAAVLLVASASAVAIVRWRASRSEPADARAAWTAVAAGRWDEASVALARWREDAPGDPEADLVEGRILIERGEVIAATEVLKKAVAAGAPLPRAVVLRALIAAKTNRTAEALPRLQEEFAQARAADRQVDEALAKIYLETFDLGRAATVINRWARDFPDDPKPFLWRAEIHARDGGDPGRTLDDYQDALARDPNLAPALFGKAEALRTQYRNAEAVAPYDACLAIEPDHAAAHLGAGRNLLELGDDEAAGRLLRRASDLAPGNPEPLKELAFIAQRRGDWSSALDFLDRATAVDPNDGALRYRRSIALGQLGRAEEAKAELAASDRLRAEVRRLNEARSRLIDHPHDRDTELEIARWLFDHGRDDEGARWAQRILADHPGDPDASRLLADYHRQRGELGLANFHNVHAATEAQP